MIALLVVAGFLAGLVASIAGGGGLITLPALMAAGLSPAVALATNKGQQVFGSMSSFVEYGRKGQVDWRRAPWSFAFALIGAVAGAQLVLWVDLSVLRVAVLAVLVCASALALVRKPVEGRGFAAIARHARVSASVFALTIGLYDGFFGAGTGTYVCVLGFAYLFGDALVRAAANAKAANSASNLGAMVLFAASGATRWDIALPMGLAQLAGAQSGRG